MGDPRLDLARRHRGADLLGADAHRERATERDAAEPGDLGRQRPARTVMSRELRGERLPRSRARGELQQLGITLV